MFCPDSSCDEDQFKCVADNKCIPREFLCDHDNDCEDMSDELTCSRFHALCLMKIVLFCLLP